MLIMKTSIQDHDFLHYITNPYKTAFFLPLEFNYILSFINNRKQVTEMSNVACVAGQSLKTLKR